MYNKNINTEKAENEIGKKTPKICKTATQNQRPLR
jgi:hypothetical protein